MLQTLVVFDQRFRIVWLPGLLHDMFDVKVLEPRDEILILGHVFSRLWTWMDLWRRSYPNDICVGEGHVHVWLSATNPNSPGAVQLGIV